MVVISDYIFSMKFDDSIVSHTYITTEHVYKFVKK